MVLFLTLVFSASVSSAEETLLFNPAEASQRLATAKQTHRALTFVSKFVRFFTVKGISHAQVHIPTTYGTAMRGAMPRDYKARFPLGHTTNASCGVVAAMRSSLTPAEAVACGVVEASYYTSRYVLCLVRKPLDRLLNLLRTNFKNNVTALTQECKEVRPDRAHFLYSHCRPQTDYLYHENKPVCDLVVSNPIDHVKLLGILNVSFGRRVPSREERSILAKSNDTDRLMEFVQSHYATDLDDPIINGAVAGQAVFPATHKEREQFWLPMNPRDESISSSSSRYQTRPTTSSTKRTTVVGHWKSRQVPYSSNWRSQTASPKNDVERSIFEYKHFPQ